MDEASPAIADEKPLPDSSRRAVGRYNSASNLLGFFGITGSLVVPVLLFGQPGESTDSWLNCVYIIPFVTMIGWLIYRDWRIRRGWPCPQCSCGMRMEREPPSQRGNFLLTCRHCGTRWDSGITFYKERHSSDSGG